MQGPRLARGNRWSVLLIAITGSILLTAGIITFAYVFFTPPDGPPLATHDIQSGEPFELKFRSDGKSLRVWLDMRCESCAFPVDGRMEVSAHGKTLFSNEISAGNSRDRAWGAHSRSLEQHLLFEVPAHAPDEEVTVKGSLTVRAPRDGLTGAPVKGAPAPQLRLFRLSVTN